MGQKMTNIEYLVWLKKETKQIERTKKTYKLQSEWHKMMYARTHEIEILERLLNNEQS